MDEEMTFLPRRDVLSLEEIYEVASTFVSLGVKKIRLTGGEPLIRKGALSLIKHLGQLNGLEHLVLTTNGSQLANCADDLVSYGVERINISLDSLREDRFKSLTRTGHLPTVLAGIQKASRSGFKRIKLNAVILKGRNDDEILELVDYARSINADISFIEEMPLGHISEHHRGETYMSSDEILEIINECYQLTANLETTGGPSRYYSMIDSGTRVGFISPHSHNFCGSCNRVRVTAEGRLLLCLGNEHSVDLKAVMRRPEAKIGELAQSIQSAMAIKPERHYFDNNQPVDIIRFMNMTGG
jgi:cyclic pyranopterin phosphate synthase